ncbi:MAG: hypothetical protein JO019_03930 [Candidatus Kaiserbacteria bacterium]|nr:hypothetical protein [Candidatus Kaiserbacteria bacterium]
MNNVVLRERVFDSAGEKQFFGWYRRFFSVAEIEARPTLQLIFGALLFSLLISFIGWAHNPSITIGSYLSNSYVCWPYFQTCGEHYFLQGLSHGYSQTALYAVLLGIIALAAWLAYKKEWVLAHVLVVILWLWKALVVFALTRALAQNFDYYEIILLFVLLFLPRKLFFLRLTFVSFYFLASTVKFSAGWILGSYFTSLQNGLPLFGSAFAPLYTNFVIALEAIGSWFLLSEQKRLRYPVFALFVLFHLYSSIIIGYRYPVLALSILIILFGISDEREDFRFDKSFLPGMLFLALLFAVQFSPLFIPGDERLTGEGNRFRLFMFEANHQCISKFTINWKSGAPSTIVRESANARVRCDLYNEWFWVHQVCLRRSASIKDISWTFDHSIDGGPFYRLVDTNDACALDYAAFSHNTWIHLPENGAPIVGYPLKDLYE